MASNRPRTTSTRAQFLTLTSVGLGGTIAAVVGVPAADYLLAVEDLQAYARAVARSFAEVDLWLNPTLAEPPPRLGAINSSPDGQALLGRFVAFAGIVANITGGPAMSVPLHWTAEGLPIGVHFLGRYGDEATLLRLASQLETAQPWATRRPE